MESIANCGMVVCVPNPVVPAARLADLLGTPPPDRPAYRALGDAIRHLISDGRLVVGSRLPSERDLTDALGVSRTTVTRAYVMLREAGFVSTRRGSGTVVTMPSGSPVVGTGGALMPADLADGSGVIDLTCAAPRAVTGTAEACERALARLPSYLAGPGYLSMGIPELRAAIAARYAARGLPTRPDQVVVTSGAVAGLASAVDAVVTPHDRVVVETPSYPNAVSILRHRRVRLGPVPVTAQGWDTSAFAALLRARPARAALLIPDFHNPTGALMPADQRREIAEVLHRGRVTAIIDESLCEIDLDPDQGPLPPPFAAFDPTVVSVGSAAKTHWGGLRIGWVRAPVELVDRLVGSRASHDLGAPVLDQLVLAELLTAPVGLDPGRRAELAASRDAAMAALTEALPEVAFSVPRGGLCLWLRLPGMTATATAVAAQDEGLLLASGPRFAVRGGLDHWLRLPYVLPPADMREAVARLARAIAKTATSGPGRPAPGTTPDFVA